MTKRGARGMASSAAAAAAAISAPLRVTQQRKASPATQVATQDTVKMVLLGDSGVGKSSLALRLVHGRFDESSESTIGTKDQLFF